MFTLRGEERDVMTFGVDKGDVHAENLSMDHGFGSFDVMCRGKKYAHLDLSVPGMHNVKNAIAAAAAAIALGAGAAMALFRGLWPVQAGGSTAAYPPAVSCLLAFVACLGFCLPVNAQGVGAALCALGGAVK